MSLLEFNNWRKTVGDQEKANALDQVFLDIKRMMTRMIDEEGEVNKKMKYSSRYDMLISLSVKHDTFVIVFSKSKKKKKGGAIKRPVEEIAFDAFNDDDLQIFLKEVFVEIFIYSNFFHFNGNDNKIVTSEIKENTADKTIVR